MMCRPICKTCQDPTKVLFKAFSFTVFCKACWETLDSRERLDWELNKWDIIQREKNEPKRKVSADKVEYQRMDEEIRAQYSIRAGG